MAKKPKKVKFNFRKLFRKIAREVQQENLTRLLAGREITGSPVEPLATRTLATKSTKKTMRLRVLGMRISLGDLLQRPGVRSGKMLKNLTKASNIKVRKNGFKIVPKDSEMVKRWIIYNAGAVRQPGARGASKPKRSRRSFKRGRLTVRERIKKQRTAETQLAHVAKASIQPPREVGGMTDAAIKAASKAIAKEAREQMVKAMNRARAKGAAALVPSGDQIRQMAKGVS